MAGPLKSGRIESDANLSNKTVAIITAEWNEEITGALTEGAFSSLTANGIKRENIIRKTVPGYIRALLAGLWMAEEKHVDAVICLGCAIQGETPHFDYISVVAYGVTEASPRAANP